MLRDEAVFSPTAVRKRVYIIDEVHMLSKPAFNALLKILEEPPAHLMFILATTELNKVPPTILSRCQRHSFRRLDADTISGRLSYVASCEGIRLEQDAADLLGRLADGGMRDALSLLDQCSGREVVDQTAVLSAMGLAGTFRIRELADRLLRHETAECLDMYGALWRDGKDPDSMLGELSGFFRDVLLFRLAPRGGRELLSGAYTEEALRSVSGSDAGILWMLNTLQRYRSAMASAADPRLQGELCMIELCGTIRGPEPDDPVGVNPFREAAETGPAEATGEVLPEQNLPPVSREPETEPARTPNTGDAVPQDLWKNILHEIRTSVGIGEYIVLSDPEKVTGIWSAGELVLRVLPGFEGDMVKKSDVLQKIRTAASRIAGKPVAVLTEEKKTGASELNEDRLKALERFDNVTIR